MYFVLCFLFISFSGISSQKINHPTLLFTANKIQLAKQRIKEDPNMARAWKEVQQKADEFLSKNDLMKTDYLSLANLMTGEQKYAEKAKEVLLHAVKTDTWADAEMMSCEPTWNSELQIAHKSFVCAVSYDRFVLKCHVSKCPLICNESSRNFGFKILFLIMINLV